jgi:hypothetical protein
MGEIRRGLSTSLAIALAVPLAGRAAADEAVRRGRFHEGAHGGHPISGGAAIYVLAGGGYKLRLDGAFGTVPSPDLMVYVSAAPDAETTSRGRTVPATRPTACRPWRGRRANPCRPNSTPLRPARW